MKKGLCLLLSAAMIASLMGCSKTDSEVKETTQTSEVTEATEVEEDLDYEFGEHFKSDEPVAYSMFWSDHEAYPITENWKLFSKIEELTNVKLDISKHTIARTDYDEKKALMISSGESAYIVPKTYDENQFVDGGAIVAISDYTKYMPNYTAFVEQYQLGPDIQTIEKEDGKYYRLPGLKETSEQEYTFMIRSDLFDAAGVDYKTLEKDWNWQGLLDALVKVKAYMVAEGMCKESDYIWTERWQGDDGSGGNLLKLVGATYGVRSGWDVADGMQFDREKDEWFFSETTPEYKEYVTQLHKFVEAGILNPESFTITDEQSCAKFYNGESVMLGVNKSMLTTYQENLDSTLGKDKYGVYQIVYPVGKNKYTAESARLENGIMISSKALEELGEEDFIKMLRFIDWLWYSEEGKTLAKWGVEGETYEVAEDGSKTLLPQYYCGGLSIPQTSEDQKDMRIEYGYAGGVFTYAGTYDQVTDNYSDTLKEYFDRVSNYREVAPVRPAVSGSEEDNEQINLIKTPLIDNVNSWTLQFITGQKDIEKDWDTYVMSCENLNSQQLVDLYNEIYTRNKK